MNVPVISKYTLNDVFDHVTDVYFLHPHQHANPPMHKPFRRTFYAVGICISGEAEMQVNLESYAIKPNCLMVKPPYVIHQWKHMSDNFRSLTVFFSRDFITTNNTLPLDQLDFLDLDAKHVFSINASQAQAVTSSLNLIYQKYETSGKFRDDMVRNHISSLLFEIASFYDKEHAAFRATQSRSQFLVSSFKKQISAHFLTERKVEYYAEQLSITPKYLTEIVKKETGRTTSQWITEVLVTEAKLLLHDPSLSIAQVADALHFPDQSTFGRFFKKSTELSPMAYKKNA